MITIAVQDQQVLAYLSRLQAKLKNLKPAMAGIGMELEAAVSGRFESKTDPAGRAWAPWASATQRSYPDDGNGTILDRYGDMLDSLNHRATKDSVEVGFGVPYAAYHEWGTVKMPRRGLLTADPDGPTLSAADTERVLDILSTFLGAGEPRP
jgi:phage virion morphogenesis protein